MRSGCGLGERWLLAELGHEACAHATLTPRAVYFHASAESTEKQTGAPSCTPCFDLTGRYVLVIRKAYEIWSDVTAAAVITMLHCIILKPSLAHQGGSWITEQIRLKKLK